MSRTRDKVNTKHHYGFPGPEPQQRHQQIVRKAEVANGEMGCRLLCVCYSEGKVYSIQLGPRVQMRPVRLTEALRDASRRSPSTIYAKIVLLWG